MREHEINKLNNFIMGFYIDNDEICDAIVDFHKNNHKDQAAIDAYVAKCLAVKEQFPKP